MNGLDIYGSYTGTDSDVLPWKPIPPHNKYHRRLPPKDDDYSLESPWKITPEDFCTISVKNNQKKTKQPTIFSL